MKVQRTMVLVWVLALTALTLVAGLQLSSEPVIGTASQAVVRIGDTIVVAEVADTQALQVQGLSNRSSLPAGEGMLFVFDEEGGHSIWMKDMQFAIDIVWAASNGTIITIEERVSPNTYPQTFSAAEPRARYVLEVPAGFIDTTGVGVGDKIVVQ
jgi:hypothetical protein